MLPIISINQKHPYYPSRLLDLSDAPKEIYCLGNIKALKMPSVAIVGSRKASNQGLKYARTFSQALANQGFCIVSGLAEGIDAAAHLGALESNHPIPTIAVCGTSLDKCYPNKNRALFQQINQMGLLISEYPVGTATKPFFFPQRNRLIAALSLGTLVVEAAIKSGSLITAKCANELGREVFAIPNSISRPSSAGCHHLIKDGAKLTEKPSDIVDEMRFFLKTWSYK
ncbi:DNA-processing protein DprA [Polynucleobacter victoriensis]|uniref:DNA processing protein n=1 Tax=Polynucleobacter victoriensis TaxID=2049319 RepID=A0A212TCB3_9BURK|nr:DNA-processing protein DprA [Polynucleobacter victoriensis]SNC63673.1 DNA processing protein [Polynucleobacter victoriensis]